MGLGDDLLTIGEALEVYQQTHNTVRVRVPRQSLKSPLFKNIPWIEPVTQGHADVDHGRRPYFDYQKSGRHRQKYLPYTPRAGVIALTFDERYRGAELADHEEAVFVEPHVKATFSGQNKRWPWEYWTELVRMLKADHMRVVQVSKPGEPTLEDVDHRIESPDIRAVLASLAMANPLVTTDGLFHHAAAALNVPAVVIWGGRTPPDVLGYKKHRNLYVDGPRSPCGARTPCAHCELCMKAITPEEVYREVLSAAQ